MALLIVEDDKDLAGGLAKSLAQSGYQCEVVHTGRAAIAACRETSFELVILDLGLPDMDGFTVLYALRNQRVSTAPILILTARHEVDARVAGLDAGGDDYLSKPFALSELEARIRALLRRGAPADGPIRFGDLVLDPQSREARVNDQVVPLTATETLVLQALLRRPGRIVSKPVLLDSVYEEAEDADSSRLEVQLSRIRRKLADKGSKVRVRVLRGLGYRLEVGEE